MLSFWEAKGLKIICIQVLQQESKESGGQDMTS